MNERTIKRFLPWVVATALFMEQLDATIVNTAVPAMAESLRVTPLSLKAVAASYVLSLAVGIPVSGWIADRFGTRRVFATAIAVFTIASVLCGLCQSAGQMIVARVLQGAGAALMTPVGRLTIVRTFEKSELMTAMNFVIIPALIGPLLGPTVGGLIVHWFSWREIFFVNVPIGIVAQLLIHRHMPDYRADTPPFVGRPRAFRKRHGASVVASGDLRRAQDRTCRRCSPLRRRDCVASGLLAARGESALSAT
ncbi:MFS transporter [Methylocystis sp. H62]|uniref:MFS transporter n=1 Tax=Methylocystis sp. H62 TaxID=2785789 RepID=UPI001AEF2975|nr:MFS transporter [Methylocystis sp. H62]